MSNPAGPMTLDLNDPELEFSNLVDAYITWVLAVINDEKLEQNEALAILRADTSLVKQQMGDQNRKDIARMKAKDVKVLKGPKS